MVKTMLTGAAVAISLSACQHLAPLSPAQYAHAREHSVFIGQEGHALLPDTAGDAKALGIGDSLLYGRYIGGIMDAVRRSGKSEIMLRIHGGVNSLAEQVDTNISITKGISADSPDSSADYYPLYVNWESSISRSYVDHLLFVRQGHAYRGVNPIGWGLAPLYVVADVGRALTAAPLHWKAQITSFWGTGAVNPAWLNDSARSMGGAASIPRLATEVPRTQRCGARTRARSRSSCARSVERVPRPGSIARSSCSHRCHSCRRCRILAMPAVEKRGGSAHDCRLTSPARGSSCSRPGWRIMSACFACRSRR